MGKLNSDGHYICYYGQNSLRKNGVVLIVNKRAQNTVLGYNLKNYGMISVFINITSNPSLCPNQ